MSSFRISCEEFNKNQNQNVNINCCNCKLYIDEEYYFCSKGNLDYLLHALDIIFEEEF